MAGRRVVVVGGGLAGMAAAVALESSDYSVTLLEARKTLGGRAGSFQDPTSGEILDNCQHVLLGCCTNLLDFYSRLGVSNLIHWENDIRFVDESGNMHRLHGAPGLPAPLHLGIAGALFGALTLSERFELTRAMLAMLCLGVRGREKLADVSFGQWLIEHGQSKKLIDKFYELVLVSALNEDCRKASAMYAIQVFQESLLVNSSAYRMGTPDCPLGKLYEKLPCRDVRLSARMTGLRFSGSRVIGVEIGDEFLRADAVILAMNHHALEKWIPAELLGTDDRFGKLDRLENVPILGAHLWFDRPVLEARQVAMMGGPLQWIFRKDETGRAVHGVISAARDWVQRPKQECLDLFVEQIRKTLKPAGETKLERGVIVIEKRATFSPLPGSDEFRPAQSPPKNGIAGLFLAGDYTRTGWPATMEGAVRSGYLAAEAISEKKILVPDLPVQWPAKLLGGGRGN